MNFKTNWWKILLAGGLLLLIIYFFLPRQDINIITQMTEEETAGLRRVLNRYELYNLVNFNIVNISFNNHYNRIEEFIKADTAVDIARGDIKMPTWFKTYVVNDRTEAQAVDCLVLIYNPQIIKTPPQTIEEFLTIARQKTIDEAGNHLGEDQFDPGQIEQYGAYAPLNSGWWMSSFFGGQDQKFLTSDFNEEKFAATAEEFKNLYQQGALALPNKDKFYQWMMNKFTAGEIGMIINGPWAVPKLREADIKFKMALVPQGEEGRFSPMGGQQWIMLSDKKEVKEIMSYLSSTEAANLFYKYNGTLMPNQSFLANLEEAENNVVAKQLSQAVKIDKKDDYRLYKFFSDDFMKYIKGQLTTEKLVQNWEQELNKK